jgi:tetratricopeptide (TPR) repeat protein
MDRDLTFRISNGGDVQGTRSKTVSVAEMKVPGKARKIFEKALEAFRKARIDDAFGLVQKALGVYPDYAQALTLRGVMNMQKGDTKQAQPDLEKAVELDHADDTGFAALGALYNTEKRFDEAIQVLERGITINPTSWQSQMELARAQVGKKDADAALRTLAKAEKYIPPQVYFPHLIRSEAFIIKKNYQAAIAELDAFLKYEPTGSNAEAAKRTLAQLQSVVASAAIK